MVESFTQKSDFSEVRQTAINWADAFLDIQNPHHELVKDCARDTVLAFDEEFGYIHPADVATEVIQRPKPCEVERLNDIPYEWDTEIELSKLLSSHMNFVYSTIESGISESELYNEINESLVQRIDYLKWLRSMNQRIPSTYAWNDEVIVEHLRSGIVFLGSEGDVNLLSKHPNRQIKTELKRAINNGIKVNCSPLNITDKKELTTNLVVDVMQFYNYARSLKNKAA